MSVIRVPQHLFDRLQAVAPGLMTTAEVIERLVDFYESHHGRVEPTADTTPTSPQILSRPKLHFHPRDENEFKAELLRSRRAKVELQLSSGKNEEHIWKADRMTESSSVRANLWSGILRDWKTRGVITARISIVDRAYS